MQRQDLTRDAVVMSGRRLERRGRQANHAHIALVEVLCLGGDGDDGGGGGFTADLLRVALGGGRGPYGGSGKGGRLRFGGGGGGGGGFEELE
jgi:hypothetical protein